MKYYTKKYRKGGNITSLDELVKQEFIYIFDKIIHNGWFMNWHLSCARMYLDKGWLFYAEKAGGENNA